MKTSAAQFELLVTFMEQHGDLNKPTSDANGRIRNLKRWEQLGRILNSDGSGDTKSVEKWRKVWSDFKNKTKKKAARIHRAARGTGGGPANFTRLSDLEVRVLNLIGVQVATGLPTEEAGLPQRTMTTSAEVPGIQLDTPLPLNLDTGDQDCSQPWNEPGPSSRPHTAPPASEATPTPPVPVAFREVEIETTCMSNNNSGESPVRVVASPPQDVIESLQIEDMLTPTGNLSPVIHRRHSPALLGQTQHFSSQFHEGQVQPNPSGQTPRHTRPARTRGSPRRRARPAYTEQAAQHFLRSDEEWRKFKMEQHRDLMELRREQNRIRSDEVQVQRDWIALASRVIDSLDKLGIVENKVIF